MPRHVLLVEDAEDILLSLGEALTYHGFTVASARNGQEAIDYLVTTKPPPDCVIADLHMPVMDGEEFIEIIRSYVSFRMLPVVAISAHRTLNVSLYQPAVFLPKPFRVEQLVDAIKKALKLTPESAKTS